MLELIELLYYYWCFQTVLWHVAAYLHGHIRARLPARATVACLRGHRRAADACITGAVPVCLVRTVTLTTCVMCRRPCASEQGRVRQCAQKT